jgi:hypothetical protein
LKPYFGYKHMTLEDPPRCFNVGKGKGNRAYSHHNRNHKWHAIVKRLGLHVKVCVGFTDSECACAWEIENVAKENTFSTNHSHDDPIDIGCNFTRGGDGKPGFHVSLQTRQKQRESKLGVRNPNFGKKPWNTGKKLGSGIANKGWETRRALGKTSHASPSLESRKRMSEAQKGKVMSPEARLKISLANTGRKLTQEARQKIRQASTGRVVSMETRKKMSAAQKGRIISDKTRHKIGLAGKGRILSAEHKAKIGKANEGRSHTDEIRKQISKTLKGHIVSQESREKISQANTGRKISPDVIAKRNATRSRRRFQHLSHQWLTRTD